MHRLDYLDCDAMKHRSVVDPANPTGHVEVQLALCEESRRLALIKARVREMLKQKELGLHNLHGLVVDGATHPHAMRGSLVERRGRKTTRAQKYERDLQKGKTEEKTIG